MLFASRTKREIGRISRKDWFNKEAFVMALIIRLETHSANPRRYRRVVMNVRATISTNTEGNIFDIFETLIDDPLLMMLADRKVGQLMDDMYELEEFASATSMSDFKIVLDIRGESTDMRIRLINPLTETVTGEDYVVNTDQVPQDSPAPLEDAQRYYTNATALNEERVSPGIYSYVSAMMEGRSNGLQFVTEEEEDDGRDRKDLEKAIKKCNKVKLNI